MKLTQRDRILRHLREVGGITGAEAMKEYGIQHLASRISEMRQAGIPIKGEQETGKNRFGEPVYYVRYSLENRQEA